MEYIPVSDTVKEQVILIRDTGKTNMFNIDRVQEIAREMELTELVNFLVDKSHQLRYFGLILNGK